jgi:hypothetical protein
LENQGFIGECINKLAQSIANEVEEYHNTTEELKSTTSNDTENINNYFLEKQYIDFVSIISDAENLNFTNLMQNHFTGKLYIGEEIAIAKIKQTNLKS